MMSQKSERSSIRRLSTKYTMCSRVMALGLRKSHCVQKRACYQFSEQGGKLKCYKNLPSIKGIGPRSATVLLSVIGNINDFADVAKSCAKT